MKKKLQYLISLFAIIQLYSCNVIPPNEIETQVKIDTTKTDYVQKVYLEYFTGHKCGNCPEASEAAFKQIEKTFGDRVVYTKIHSGFFALPSTSTTTDKYKYDFRSAIGDQIFNNFKITSVPIGIVDRSSYNNSVLVSTSSWVSAIEQRLKQQSYTKIDLSASYNQDSKILSATAKITFVEEIKDARTITAYLTEDSIVTWQLDYTKDPKDVPDFVHKKALRAELIPQTNIDLGSSFSKGQEITKQFSLPIPTTWNVKNCNVVVLVLDKTTKEILQVETIKVSK